MIDKNFKNLRNDMQKMKKDDAYKIIISLPTVLSKDQKNTLKRDLKNRPF